MKYIVPIAFGAALLLAACGATSEKAKEYNNALVQLQEDLYYFNDTVDAQFVDEVWYYDPVDPKVGEFISASKARYNQLSKSVADVNDLSGHNEMKSALAALVSYCSEALDSYYLALIKDAAGDTDNKEKLDKANTERFEILEGSFISAQKALAEEFNLSLAYEEEIKH